MNNWSVDTKSLKKNPEKYALWKLEQLINFGLGREKLNRQDLEKNIKKIKIDPKKKKFLKFLLS